MNVLLLGGYIGCLTMPGTQGLQGGQSINQPIIIIDASPSRYLRRGALFVRG